MFNKGPINLLFYAVAGYSAAFLTGWFLYQTGFGSSSFTYFIIWLICFIVIYQVILIIVSLLKGNPRGYLSAQKQSLREIIAVISNIINLFKTKY